MFLVHYGKCKDQAVLIKVIFASNFRPQYNLLDIFVVFLHPSRHYAYILQLLPAIQHSVLNMHLCFSPDLWKK